MRIHHFNPVRLKFILDSLSRSIKNLTVLDIGCGGGILSEPLSRLGADVTAIDENEQAIKITRVTQKNESKY